MEQKIKPVTAAIKSVQTEEKEKAIIQLDLDKVFPDPKQPRKTFESKDESELSGSIKEHGVLQAILVRPHPAKPNNYMIVFGERRYRASLALKATYPERNTIPATVKNLSDAEALELQIIENLQRKDVHPMEEAKGFFALINDSNYSVDDIANGIGKSVYFVRQRLKLNDLIPKWQKMYSKNAFKHSLALQLCVLPENLQLELYKNEVTKEKEKEENPVLNINSYTIERLSGNLTSANFDLNDAELDKKAGACSVCPFNSAVSSLFPDQEKSPVCNNIGCFRNKMNITFNKDLKTAIEDPTVILVYNGYTKPEVVDTLVKEGHTVYHEGYGDECRIADSPSLESYEEFKAGYRFEKMSEKELKTQYQKEIEEYNKEKAQFDKNVTTAKYKKAFVVGGNNSNVGRYIYVLMTEKKEQSKSRKAVENGTASMDDIENEIKRLQEREKRNKELDAEKVHKRIIESLNESNNLKEIPKTSHRNDNILVNFLLSEHMGFHNRERYKKLPMLSNGMAITREKFYSNLESLTKQQVSFLVRQIILNKYSAFLPNSKEGYMMRKMAESLPDIPIAQFEKEHKEKAETREQRVNSRITDLRQQLKTLQKNKEKSTPIAKTKVSKKNTTAKKAA